MLRIWRATEAARTFLVVVLGILLLWEICVHVLHMPEFLVPSPSVVLHELIDKPDFYLANSMATLWISLAGFAVSAAAGLVLSVAIIRSIWLERTLYTLLVGLNSLPKVALAPLFVIWFGTGGASKIAVVITIAIFPIVIGTVLGLRSIDPELVNMARAVRASQRHILWKLRFPQALPSLLSGMKVSISLALVGTVVGEFIAGNNGLGSTILAAQGAFDTTQVFVCIVLLGVLGAVLFYAIDLAERFLIPWHPSHREKMRRAAAPQRAGGAATTATV
ncbi:ABC transporter permease [Pigmentiphaga soli]|uniref:ABC transporter permease n=1 Tax=Pigmentiphaga soli TaxID=1007095 RepID=A0ABP8H690_9BURK